MQGEGAHLTKRLKGSQDSESKLQAEVEDCKRKLNQPNKDPLQETKDPPPCIPCKECTQKLTDCELKWKEIQLKLEECEKRPPRVEYRYVYTPYFVTSIVTQFVPKLVFVKKIIERTKIKEIFKYVTEFKIKRQYITQYRDRIVNRVVHVPVN
ncbi:hypothetical protein M758_9G150200 [Ceratodon purpureus]|nr:hypothetical protein M758_9G150200 [Ceratodon purpureus]